MKTSMRLFFLLHFAVFVTSTFCAVPIHSAHLPVPRSVQRLGKTRPHNNAPVALRSRHYSYDDKRAIASRLLRKAASHRQRTLRDVLSRAPKPQYQQQSPTKTKSSLERLQTASDYLFPQHNSTVSSHFERPSISLHVDAQHGDEYDEEQNVKTERTDRQEDTSASERKLLAQSIAALRTKSPTRVTAALRTVEELCHSMHNGVALQQISGLRPILDALTSRHRRVRAGAAWAIATCCQNNRAVQKELLKAGAVPMVARLAWKDVLKVRARALFALNAMLGMEEARLAFEKLPFATQLLFESLRDTRDFRATRRALNLVELLVRKDLDAWKTQLEAWDVPPMVEKLLREHSDIDVKESAARIIATLDGNPNVG